MPKQDKKDPEIDKKEQPAPGESLPAEPTATAAPAQPDQQMPSLTPDSEPAIPAPEPATQPVPSSGTGKKSWKAFFKTKKGIALLAALGLLLILAITFIVPVSRYAVAGLVIKKDVPFQIIDSETGKPVSDAQLTMQGQTVRTDGDGKATIKQVPVGEKTVDVKKTYHQDAQATLLVPILNNPDITKIGMTATGRQVPVVITHKITGKPLSDVEIVAGDATGKTNTDGEATIVLPADQAVVNATFKANGYNSLAADITVTEQLDDKNKFALTPSGKIYFLSKRTGKINVMKSDLDGSNAAVVLAGTGKESETNTVLLASRDWKYLALLSKRDGDDAKLYLITTADDKLSVIDEGKNVGFELSGWSNDSFIYSVNRGDRPAWESKRQSLKSFNAVTKKLVTLDDSDGLGSAEASWAHDLISNVYILDNEIVYTKNWFNAFASPGLLSGKKDSIVSVKADGSNKKTLKDFDATTASYIESRLYEPAEVYFRVKLPDKAYFYEYEGGKVLDAPSTNDSTFYDTQYPTYLVSPSGKYTFWYEARDGKNVNIVGNAGGADGKEVLVHADFWTYGWYSDDYLLLSRKGSELYILPREPSEGESPLKITDYHKPTVQFYGYGYGYGGL